MLEENLRYFPALLPMCEPEDPVEARLAGRVPRLAELRLHNGTVYRWNRPVYDVMNGRPHLRVENRVLPAGPTVLDILANMAFYLGLLRDTAEADRPIWTHLTFSQAEENLHAASRDGLQANLFWPQMGEVAVRRLVLDRLLPRAQAGLDRLGVATAVRDRLLEVIEQRCRTGRNGAAWQAAAVEYRQGRRHLDRPAALRSMLLWYAEGQVAGAPVHTWPVPG
jgi:gamma-glutamyl:cysteine ligase YbdK (ATP-grasp superfamily)